MSDKSPFIGIPTYGVVFLFSAIVLIAQYFSGESFGFLGILAWVVVLAGVIGFVYNALNQ